MKIAINGRFLTQRTTGTQRYALNILSRVDQILEEPSYRDLSVELIVPKNCTSTPNYKNISLVRGGWFKGHLWEQLALPWLSRRAAVLVSLINSAPVLRRKQIVTFHDCSIFDRPETYNRKYAYFHRILRIILKKTASKILTVSEFSRDRLVYWLKVKKENVVIIPNGCDHIPIETVCTRHNGGEKFILFVGGISPNKNLLNLCRAMRIASVNMKIKVVGASESKVFATNDIWGEYGDIVEFVGFVSDDQLVDLYRTAQCLAFVSFYEGFGIPVLEAMACECPVIASDIPPLREIAADHALFVDPKKPQSIADAILALQDEGVRNKMIVGGIVNVARYRWELSARRLLDAIT